MSGAQWEAMPRHDPTPKDGIANPHAWARFRTIMRWMTALALLCVGATLLYLTTGGTPVTASMIIAASLGVFLTVMVATALMSLVFLSHGSGHDEEVADPFDERR
jgi:uncharacterized membrane protein